MKLSRASLAFYFVLVFVAGGVVGALSYRLYTTASVNAMRPPRGPDEYRRRYLDEMRTRLKLDQGQFQRLDKILDETRDQVRAVRERMDPEMKKIRDEQIERVNGILNESQRQEYLKMRQEREKKAPPPPPPPHDRKPGC
jgi:hypothetical protein